MPFRHRAPEPEPEWKRRSDRAAETIRQYRSDAPHTTRDLLLNLTVSLATAVRDRDQLAIAITDIDGDQIDRELKAALRARPSANAPDTPLIRSLRQRHELRHQLLNRLDELNAQIEQTVVDLETTAARAIEVSFSTVAPSGAIDGDLQRLNDDLEALQAARREIADL